MTTYRGTEDVDPGLYLNTRKLTIASVDKRGSLPGTVDETYRRVPVLLMLAAAPLVGLVYVMFLPFIGFAAVTWLLADKGMQFAGRFAGQVGRVRRPGWVPAMAFLSRTKAANAEHDVTPATTEPAATAGNDAQHDAWSEEVESKLNDRERAGR